jgi:hypothetical protein
MTLQEYQRQNPGVTVSDSGRWLVQWHGARATRYENYFVAEKESKSECIYCDGSKPHKIYEINEPKPAPAPRTIGFKQQMYSRG